MNTGADINLFWIPLGAGGRVVRWNGRIYEAIAARAAHRAPRDLYHAALTVGLDGVTTSIEMGPVWNVPDADRGVVGTGPVGSRLLGRIRMFRYEIRCWPGGRIPDLDYAVASHEMSSDRARATRVLELTREVPLATWGRDEQRAGEMWNSNSMVSWLLSRSGHDLTSVQPPARGRAPGWDAGIFVAAQATSASPRGTKSGDSRPGRTPRTPQQLILSRPRRDTSDGQAKGEIMHVTEALSTARDTLTVKRVFAEPYEKDGITLIAAAAVLGGAGGGHGTDPNGQEGEGGGYAAHARPVGAYILTNGRVTWRPALNLDRLLTLLCMVALALLLRRPHSRKQRAPGNSWRESSV